MKSGLALAIPAFVAFHVGTAAAGTFTVRPDGSGDFPTIQEAIDEADFGDIVELTNGVFDGEGNRNLDFLGKSITLRSESGIAEACVIDGEGEHTGIYFRNGEGPASVVEGIQFENCVVLERAGADPTRVLNDGTQGRSSGLSGSSDPGPVRVGLAEGISFGPEFSGGGAIVCDGSSPTIRDCGFIANEAPFDKGAGGGGILCAGSSPLIVGCAFVENIGGLGAAVGVFAGSAPRIVDCLFEENTGGFGGAILVLDASATIQGCDFIQNFGFLGGAIFSGDSDVVIEYCDFDGNGATFDAASRLPRPVVSDLARWEETRGDEEVYGGACAFDGGSASVLESRFFENYADDYGGNFQISGTETEIANSTISHGYAPLGAGLGVSGTAPVRVRNTIISFSEDGEAIHCPDSDADVGLYCSNLFANDGGDWSDCVADQATVSGNVSVDPQFCEADLGDLTLSYGSPCVVRPDLADCTGGIIGLGPVGCDGEAPTVADVGEGGTLRASLLGDLVPSPTSRGTRTQFTVPVSNGPVPVRLDVFDAGGRHVRTLESGMRTSGLYTVDWDGRDELGRTVSGGVYFLNLQVGEVGETRSLVVVR